MFLAPHEVWEHKIESIHINKGTDGIFLGIWNYPEALHCHLVSKDLKLQLLYVMVYLESQKETEPTWKFGIDKDTTICPIVWAF
jgi:hypothetical protein